jgi:AraC-like DNA-binding protein
MKPLELIFATLLAVGALQGLVYAVILWRAKGNNNSANTFLATILLFFSYRLIVELLKLFGLGNYDVFYHIFLEYNWIYGALIYFFVKAFITPNFKFDLKLEWIHFLPVLIEFGWSNFIKTQNFYWDGTKESLSSLGYWGYVIWMHYPTQYIISAALVVFYCVKSRKLLQKMDYPLYEIMAENTIWVKRILIIMMTFSIVVIAVVMIDLLFFEYAFNRSYHYPIFIGMALITYSLGLLGFSKKDVPVIKPKVVLDSKEKDVLERIAKHIKLAMTQDKIYKNPKLSVKLLSEHIGEKSYLITKSLSLIKNKKFNDYINEYRIEELKSLLKEEKNAQFTLLALAFEAGFNSKASFNRAVKKQTGKSPSDLKSTL